MTENVLSPEPQIFSAHRELERLTTQNRLMHECETPILRELLAGKRDLKVLDVGSNNGEKTVRWFSDPAVVKVLGLEYNAPLALQAQENYGDGRFRFCPCDAEAEDFVPKVRALMAQEGIGGFDVVYLSFLLSHLNAPETLLLRLRPLMESGGVLVAVETDDSRAVLAPEDRRFGEFLRILAKDPFAGDRSLGGRLPSLLSGCGFRGPKRLCDAISAGPGEEERKAMIFEMFFSYLPEDVSILLSEAPEEALFAGWDRWLKEHHAALRRSICAASSRISMGMSVVCAWNRERS